MSSTPMTSWRQYSLKEKDNVISMVDVEEIKWALKIGTCNFHVMKEKN